jgi:hypothetical protein
MSFTLPVSKRSRSFGQAVRRWSETPRIYASLLRNTEADELIEVKPEKEFPNELVNLRAEHHQSGGR